MIPRADHRLDVVHVNELKGGAATTAHLLEFDSVHGRWRESFGAEDDRAIRIGNRRIGFSEAALRRLCPGAISVATSYWSAPGKFVQSAQLDGYFSRGVKQVIVAAPVKDGGTLNIVVGVNDQLYEPARHRLLTAASCTTNCLAPVVKVLHEAIGIRHGQITTIHDPTNTNVVVDAPHRDLRRARSAMLSLSPTTTGSATAIALIYPGTQGQAERPCGAGAGAERKPDRLRVRDGADGHREARSTSCFATPRPDRSPASWASRRGRWCPPIT